ncbi:DUF572-domain-containing protein [Tilletiaria anomala UBC 951]|uniref:DUF572-domain-containing protein n=1 Tax=Tilletiaria anomala (strain ATCC 24038 / CBS 436.72 / UBC 951) TaxID=1037660 RepID=A0A066VT94_TILAU|nr:DUF572-domain-containing protein [Tilletiaria anomala UBC 951]KDN41795.1 DUF572-domain-containing protein [Tilletiaria anomala UBC 951]
MQGFNMGRYRPYDSDPRKESFNSLVGKHPLGDRARKLDQGILIVRFELPFNVWCDGCKNHIGQGVRYNAEKKKVGSYLSTPIWSFRCKCHLCSNWFEVRTDPQNTRYVVESGARQQNQEWDADANGSFSIELGDAGPSSSKAEAPKDPFAALEKANKDKTQAKTSADRIAELEEFSESRWSDPYTLNSTLRRQLRKEKRALIREGEADDAVRKRIGWTNDFPLAKEDEGTRDQAMQAWRQEKGKQREENAKFKFDRDKLSLGLATPRNTVPRCGERARPSSSLSASAIAVRGPSKPTHKRSATGSPAQQLAAKLASNTRRRRDPFLQVVRDSVSRK